MNDPVVDWCRAQGLEVTRSRTYHKNDPAWVEQKNGSIVRRLVGYGRFEVVPRAHARMRPKDIFKLLLLVKGTQCRHWTISPTRSNGSTWSSPASMRSARGSLASSVSWKRPSGCSRATARAQRQEKRPRCRR